MVVKSLLVSGSLACLACSPAPALSPAMPLASEQGCRTPNATDYPSERTRVRNHTDFTRQHYPGRILEFRQDPLECGDTVMLGDSLTERFDWQGSINASGSVRNRGIAGDTSDGVLARLEELHAAQPRAVFLMIGTNDLWTSNSPRKVAGNIEQIISELRTNNPEVAIYLQTVLPLRSEPALNRKVQQINARLVELAGDSDIELIDTYAHFRDGNGLLAQEFTDDGVHLTGVAYARWVELINQRISVSD